jgi:predicted RNA-binding protein with PUA-like domain
MMVDVKYVKTLSRTITLKELKLHPELAGMALLRRGNRLSIMPVSEEEWHYIISLEATANQPL